MGREGNTHNMIKVMKVNRELAKEHKSHNTLLKDIDAERSKKDEIKNRYQRKISCVKQATASTEKTALRKK